MIRIGRWFGGVAALVLSGLVAGPALAGGSFDAAPSPQKWQPWVEGGGYLSTERHRGELDLFAPLWQSSVALLFFQASGKVFEDDIEEGNFALGFRQMQGSGWNLGLWAGYDVRNTTFDNTFHQFAFGFEALSDRWDLRANGYLALSGPEAAPGLAQVVLSGNGIFMIGGEEVPLSGFDGEVGYKLFGSRGNGGGWGLKDGPTYGGRSHELRVFAGGFYFDDGDALDEVAGARARIEWRIDDVIAALPGSRLTFEGEYQYDDVRDDQWEGGVRLRIPFGSGSKQAYAAHLASLTPQERRMTERVERDVDIVTVESKAESVFDTLTGVRFDRAEVVQGGGDLQGALDGNGANSLIVLDGGTTTGSFTVGPSQTLQGGASTIQVTGTRTGTTAGFTAPGAKPLLLQTLNQVVVTIDSNTHLAGLGIQGGGLAAGSDNDGVASIADGLFNVAITDTTITDMGGSAIDFEDNNNKILVANTTIQRIDGDAIDLGHDNSNVRFKNVTITDVNGRGIDVNIGGNDFAFENVTIANSGNRGININSRARNFTFNNVTVTDVAIRAFNINTEAQNFTFRNVTVANTGNIGMNIGPDADGMIFENVTVDTTGSDGIRFASRANNVTFANVSVSNAAANGFEFSNNATNISFNNVTVDTAGGDGIVFNANSSNVTIAQTSIANTDDGIVFNANNSNITIAQTTIANTADDGIFINENNTAAISDTTITGAGDNAIALEENNTVTISNTTIANTGNSGLAMGANNTVTLDTTTFAGTIGLNLLEFAGGGNTFNGAGNINDAAIGGLLCSGAGGFTGTFQIDGTVIVDGGPPCI